MTKDILPLECSIQACGLPFTVTNTLKDTTFQPETQGFLSYVMGPDYNNPNIVFQQVVTTRRGKTGKSRLNANMILSPIFKVPGIDFTTMFPKTEDRKHFVEINIDNYTTQQIIGDNKPIDNKYLAWLFSKCLFIRELDKAIYPAEHQIMSTLQMNNNEKQVHVWPKDKLNKLKNFLGNIERMFNDEEFESIGQMFSNDVDKMVMLTQIRSIEAALLIPHVEYQRKIISVMRDALDYISKFIHDENNKVADVININHSLKQNRKIIKNLNTNLDNTMKSRLNAIAKNKQLLNF